MGNSVQRAAIVCGVDHSEGSRRALRVSAELAERLDSRLLLVDVRRSPADVPPGMASELDVVRERAVAGGRRLLEELGAEFLEDSRARHLLELVAGRVELGDPAARLARVADEVGATLIVVGSRGRGRAGSLLLGSVADRRVGAVATCGRSAARGGDPKRTDAAREAAGHRALCAASTVRITPPTPCALPRDSPPRSMSGSCWRTSSRTARKRQWPRSSSMPNAGRVLAHAWGPSARFGRGRGRRGRGDPRTRGAGRFAGGAGHEGVRGMIAVGTRGHGDALKALVLGSVSRALAATGACPVLIVNDRPNQTADERGTDPRSPRHPKLALIARPPCTGPSSRGPRAGGRGSGTCRGGPRRCSSGTR